MEFLRYDLRHAIRQLRQRPLFAAVAIVSIAIGIGANTAILSVANVFLLRTPAGLDDPSRIVEVSRTMGGRGRDTFSYPELLDMRAGTPDVFEGLAAWNMRPVSYSTGGDGERLTAMIVSYNYFSVMGLQPARGRFFTADEDQVPMAHPVVVVSDRFWRERLGADVGAVGSTVTLNRRAFTIVGVLPASFNGHIIAVHPDLFVPMMMYGAIRPGFNSFDVRWASFTTVVGRLRPGVTVATASAALQTVFTRMPQANDDPRNARSAVADPIGLTPAPVRGPVTAFVAMLTGLVGIILLVTCANVAGMLLARATARHREIAIRLALGSSRARLVRQLTIEALLLFGIGGSLGVAFAVWGTSLLNHLPLSLPLPVDFDVTPDARVLAVGLLLALITGLTFGLVPALQATRGGLTDAMKISGQSVGRGGRLRRVFVMGQVGLSLVLLLAAGLFLRSLQKAAAVPTGFDATNVQDVSFDLSIDGYDEARGQVFLADLLARLEAAPGVTGAGVTTDLPLDLGKSETPAYVPGSPAADARGQVNSVYNNVTSGYFGALHIPLLAGRLFDAHDNASAAPVVVINRAFAEQVWPGREPIGLTFRFEDAEGPVLTVVGVVEDVKDQFLMETIEPAMYRPVTQDYRPRLDLLVRGAPGIDVAATVRRVLHEADPALSLGTLASLESVTSLGILPQRMAAAVTTVLGILALVLSTLGVYGVVAFTVAQRTREIGVRMALGARSRNVVLLVLRGGLGLALPGLAFGLVTGLGLSVVLRSFVLGVPPGDPATFVGIPAVLLLAVLVACWAPARRAAAVEPTEALRAE